MTARTIKEEIKKNHPVLIWADLEMTGLDPLNDKIIEIATVVTDHSLNIIATGPELVIHQSDQVLDEMDEWNTKHHGASGLIEKVKNSTICIDEAQNLTLEFIQEYANKNEGTLAGNSIWQDRRFIYEQMPKVDQYLHYRMLDISSLKILFTLWSKEELCKKKESHRALDDIMESIDELKFYRKKMLSI